MEEISATAIQLEQEASSLKEALSQKISNNNQKSSMNLKLKGFHG